MGRVNFRETCTIPGGVAGALTPLEGIAYIPYIVNADGSQGAQALAYAGRTGSEAASTFATDVSGSVSYWLEAGDYNIEVSDQQSPPRIQPYTLGFTAPIIDTTALLQNSIGLIQFTGDTKFSMQTADHGLKSDGTYEWLSVASDADGGGRKVNGNSYQSLWNLLGSPALDSNGNFRLPNVSGRALIAAGAASGLTVRHLYDLVGEETHLLAAAEGATNGNGSTGNDTPDHTHSGTTGGTSNDHTHYMNNPPTNPGNAGWGTVDVAAGAAGVVPTNNNYAGGGQSATGGSLSDHTHGFGTGGASARHTHPLNARSADNTHNNMQPSAGMNLFVKT